MLIRITRGRSVSLLSIPTDYEERVYAGVLGKIIGVYLGRPVEGWTYERITEELGEIRTTSTRSSASR